MKMATGTGTRITLNSGACGKDGREGDRHWPYGCSRAARFVGSKEAAK